MRSCLSRFAASTVDLRADQVWAGNGSNEVLQHVLQAFGGPGRTALGCTPAYSMHPIISAGTGTAWVDGLRGVGTDTFALGAAGAVAQIEEHDPDVVFLCSPNNPTGTALPTATIEAVCEAALAVDIDGAHPVVVVDEAYVEFAPDGASAVALLDELDRLVVCRTFSKAWRLAGLRLGYLLAPPWVIDDLRKVRLPYHLDAITQTAGLVALELADVRGELPEVAKHYPSEGGDGDAEAAWPLVREAFASLSPEILDSLRHPLQTNEPARCGALVGGLPFAPWSL